MTTNQSLHNLFRYQGSKWRRLWRLGNVFVETIVLWIFYATKCFWKCVLPLMRTLIKTTMSILNNWNAAGIRYVELCPWNRIRSTLRKASKLLSLQIYYYSLTLFQSTKLFLKSVEWIKDLKRLAMTGRGKLHFICSRIVCREINCS